MESARRLQVLPVMREFFRVSKLWSPFLPCLDHAMHYLRDGGLTPWAFLRYAWVLYTVVLRNADGRAKKVNNTQHEIVLPINIREVPRPVRTGSGVSRGISAVRSPVYWHASALMNPCNDVMHSATFHIPEARKQAIGVCGARFGFYGWS